MSIIAEAMQRFGRRPVVKVTPLDEMLFVLREMVMSEAARRKGVMVTARELPNTLESIRGSLDKFASRSDRIKTTVGSLVRDIGDVESVISAKQGVATQGEFDDVFKGLAAVGEGVRGAYGGFADAREGARDLAATLGLPFTRSAAQKAARGINVAKKKEKLATRLKNATSESIMQDAKMLATNLNMTFDMVVQKSNLARQTAAKAKKKAMAGQDATDDISKVVEFVMDLRDLMGPQLFAMTNAIEGRMKILQGRLAKEGQLVMAEENERIAELLESLTELYDGESTEATVEVDLPTDALQAVLGVLATLEQSGDFKRSDLDHIRMLVEKVLFSEFIDDDLEDLADALDAAAAVLDDRGYYGQAETFDIAVEQIDEYLGDSYVDDDEDYDDEEYEDEVEIEA